MQDVKDALKALEESKIFLEYKKDNSKSYLVNAFTMVEPKHPDIVWQLGYYNKNKDRIVTFVINDEVERHPESEVFKEKDTISPLEISKVKIGVETGIENALKCQKKKYPRDFPMKSIILLQNFEGHSIYNITFVTQTFKTLNIKISSQDGRVVDDKIHSLFDFNDKSR